MSLGLSRKVIFLGLDKRQIYTKPNTSFDVRLVGGEKKGQVKIALVFRQTPADAGWASRSGDLSLVLVDPLNQGLLDHIAAIIASKELESFYLKIEAEPGQKLAEVGEHVQVHLVAQFGTFQTQSVYAIDQGLLANHFDLSPQPVTPAPAAPISQYLH
jgi:hypothetical protein